MSPHRFLGVLLVCLQAGAVGYTSETVSFPLCIAAAALSALVSKRRLKVPRDQRAAIVLVVALTFVVKYLVAPHEFAIGARFIRTELAHAVAQALLVLQVLQFHLENDGDHVTPLLPLLGVATMACAGDVQVTAAQRVVFQELSISFCLLAALFFAANRKVYPVLPHTKGIGRLIANAAVLLLVAGAGWFSASILYRYEHELEGLLVDLLEASGQRGAVGFSGNGHLGSIADLKAGDADQIALEVAADAPPGYLRGRVFDTMHGSHWRTLSVQQEIALDDHVLPEIPIRTGDHRFQIAAASPSATRTLVVWPESTPSGVLFAPLETALVQVQAEAVTVNDDAIIEVPEQIPGSPYTLHLTEPIASAPGWNAPASALAEQRLLALPAVIDPRIRRLAGKLFERCATPREKMVAVEAFFHEKFHYHLGIRIPPNEDPVTFFLLRRPAAHCEYFASAAVLLLRLGGVPCRYVTGFVATDRNAYGNYWVARNRDAHAWVEAYDSGHGWVIVEATPAMGVPAAQPVLKSTQFWEFLKSCVQRLRILLRQGGLTWIAAGLVSLAMTGPGTALIAGLLGWLAFVLWRKRDRWRKSAASTSPEVAALHRLLDQMDARLRKRQLERRTGETLHQFAARIVRDPQARDWHRRAAAWYRLYAASRYGAPLTAEAVRVVAQAIPADKWIGGNYTDSTADNEPDLRIKD